MLERIWKKILRRRGLSFWSIPAAGLWVISLFYSAGARLNRVRPRATVRVNVPVISVGNITVGGSGKTPVVASLGRTLLNKGYKVGIVSSGYGRTGTKDFVETGQTVATRSAEDAGDEVVLLATALPEAVFSVHPVKAEAARRLVEKSQVDLIVVDDGFQHFGLHRDLDIVTFDASVPKSHLYPLPYGVLREPIPALRLADILIVTRANTAGDLAGLTADLQSLAPKAQLFTANYQSGHLVGQTGTRPVTYLKDKKVLLFAGVGNFTALHSQVKTLVGTLTQAVELSDHQHYDASTVARLRRLVDDQKPDLVLTTGKDWVKVRSFDFVSEFYYLDLTVEFTPGQDQLMALLEQRSGLWRRND